MRGADPYCLGYYPDGLQLRQPRALAEATFSRRQTFRMRASYRFDIYGDHAQATGVHVSIDVFPKFPLRHMMISLDDESDSGYRCRHILFLPFMQI